MTLNIGIIGSTRGTSSQPIIDAIAQGSLDACVNVVLSNVKNAPILERAEKHNIPNYYIPVLGRNRTEYDADITQHLQDKNVDIVLFIGYMRIVSDAFVENWRGRILNVHPSLLPAFAGGMNENVHQAVLDSGVQLTGCTVHHVNETVDGGEIVLQKSCDVSETDTVQTLKDKVQALEGEAFVEVLKNWKRN